MRRGGTLSLLVNSSLSLISREFAFNAGANRDTSNSVVRNHRHDSFQWDLDLLGDSLRGLAFGIHLFECFKVLESEKDLGKVHRALSLGNRGRRGNVLGGLQGAVRVSSSNGFNRRNNFLRDRDLLLVAALQQF